ncbi:MAG: DUF481 domain-containing protein [Bacteriovoracaceae bacterium]|nr:DUF481 domain-containing protein [Bacteriovoracaceae bacterium]
MTLKSKIFKLITLSLMAVGINLAVAQTPVVLENVTTISNESSLGLTSFQSAQNSNLNTELYFGKHSTSLDHGLNKYKFNGEYFYGKTGEQLTARNWLAGLRYDRSLEKDWSVFFGENVEGNKFLSYSIRSNTDLGSKYFLESRDNDQDLKYVFVEGGYRLTYEDRVSQAGSTFTANSTSHKGRAASEASYLWTESFSTKFSIEYLKTFGNDHRRQVNAELGAINKLSKVLSFKASYLYNYDSSLRDQGFAYNASKTLAVSLVANY